MLRALKTLTEEDKAAIKYLSFLTLKPTMYIANVNEDGFENNPYLDKVREIAAAEGSVVVAVCAAVELTSQNSMMLTVKNSWLKWVWKSRA